MERQPQLLNNDAKASKREQRFLHFRLAAGDEALLGDLTNDQRALILLEGSYKEKAERFGLPVGTVRSRLHRARAALAGLREKRDAMIASEKTAPIH
jgi:DNA-directed RNA polymerase specialized sigma24 family protein